MAYNHKAKVLRFIAYIFATAGSARRRRVRSNGGGRSIRASVRRAPLRYSAPRVATTCTARCATPTSATHAARSSLTATLPHTTTGDGAPRYMGTRRTYVFYGLRKLGCRSRKRRCPEVWGDCPVVCLLTALLCVILSSQQCWVDL